MDSRKFLSADERDRLEQHLLRCLETDGRNATMILTALHSGARANELLSLTWSDINTDTGEVYLATLKGGRPRPVVVPKIVRDALKRLKVESPERPFNISYQRLAVIWSEYRPTPKPFRCLRHSFAMHVYQRTKDIHFTQRAMGHRSISNTLIYMEYDYSMQEFKKMMRVK